MTDEWKPCTERPIAGSLIGSSCLHCGHVNIVHPGRHNPTVEECVICKLEVQAVKFAAWLDKNGQLNK